MPVGRPAAEDRLGLCEVASVDLLREEPAAMAQHAADLSSVVGLMSVQHHLEPTIREWHRDVLLGVVGNYLDTVRRKVLVCDEQVRRPSFRGDGVLGQCRGEGHEDLPASGAQVEGRRGSM